MAGSAGGGGAGSAVLDDGPDDPPPLDFTTQADNESPMIATNKERLNMIVLPPRRA
jgi:hypothetical protein